MDADRPESTAPEADSAADEPVADEPVADEPVARGGRLVGGVRAVAVLLLVVIGTLALTAAAPAIW